MFRIYLLAETPYRSLSLAKKNRSGIKRARSFRNTLEIDRPIQGQKSKKSISTIAMEETVQDSSIVHSDDGLWSIRLGIAITDPKQKAAGAYVAVHEARLIKPCTKTPFWSSDEKETENLVGNVATCNLHEETCAAQESDRDTALHVMHHTKLDARSRNEHATLETMGSYQEIIVKIFTVQYGSRERGETEVTALKRLTAAGCNYAPTYLGDFEKKLDGFPDGMIRYVLMTRLPGYALSDRNVWRTTPSRFERVEKAFKLAIRALHACRVDNQSPFLRNILWSAEHEKCYIIDFERAELTLSSENMPAEWSDFAWWDDHDGQVEREK